MGSKATDMTSRWHSGRDLSGQSFFIRKMDTTKNIKAAEMPSAPLPMVGFSYILQGEMLVEADGRSFLCSTGQLLLIPEGMPFSINYFRDAVGYTGGFTSSVLQDRRKISTLTEPRLQAFWFDEAVFVKELFNMMEISFRSGDGAFIEKGLDILLSRVRDSSVSTFSPAVSGFLDRIFDRNTPLLSASGYSSALGISSNYLNRCVKSATGHNVSEWIDISRINLAKKLLRNPDNQIIDVAMAVGLEDQSYFSRFFKRHTGMTPSGFRSQVASMHE